MIRCPSHPNRGIRSSTLVLTVTLCLTLLDRSVVSQKWNSHKRRRLSSISKEQQEPQEELSLYGVDSSFPIHWLDTFEHNNDNDNPLMNQAKERYEDFMKGCRQEFSKNLETNKEDEEEEEEEDEYEYSSCDERNEWRMEQNVNQPIEATNYTVIGYDKRKCPTDIIKALREFYDNNVERAEVEEWSRGDVHTNHWASPTYMIDVWNDELQRNEGLDTKSQGAHLGYQIYATLKPLLEEWSGVKLKPASLYGIRIYKEGSILAPHTDTIPRISSAIINIDQDVEEDWPLEVYGRDGKAHNITMVPGDLVLYESHSLIHGRPFPLRGNKFVNLFVHFEPCVDFDKQCPEMANHGKCDLEELQGWMSENCPMSCNYCDYMDDDEDYNHYVDSMKYPDLYTYLDSEEEEDETMEEEL